MHVSTPFDNFYGRLRYSSSDFFPKWEGFEASNPKNTKYFELKVTPALTGNRDRLRHITSQPIVHASVLFHHLEQVIERRNHNLPKGRFFSIVRESVKKV